MNIYHWRDLLNVVLNLQLLHSIKLVWAAQLVISKENSIEEEGAYGYAISFRPKIFSEFYVFLTMFKIDCEKSLVDRYWFP